MVESNRPQMTIWCIHIACWMTKATHTLRICNTYCFFYGYSGCMSTPQYYIDTYIACLITIRSLNIPHKTMVYDVSVNNNL